MLSRALANSRVRINANNARSSFVGAQQHRAFSASGQVSPFHSLKEDQTRIEALKKVKVLTLDVTGTLIKHRYPVPAVYHQAAKW